MIRQKCLYQSVALAAVIGLVCTQQGDTSVLQCETVPTDCRKVEIASAGTFGFRRDKVRGVAVWREIGGIAPWVDVMPPPGQELLRITVSFDLDRADPYCFTRENEPDSVACVESIPGVKLLTVVRFPKANNRDGDVQYLSRMGRFVKYILDEVLCCQMTDYSKPERGTKLMGPGGLSSDNSACALLPKSSIIPGS